MKFFLASEMAFYAEPDASSLARNFSMLLSVVDRELGKSIALGDFRTGIDDLGVILRVDCYFEQPEKWVFRPKKKEAEAYPFLDGRLFVIEPEFPQRVDFVFAGLERVMRWLAEKATKNGSKPDLAGLLAALAEAKAKVLLCGREVERRAAASLRGDYEAAKG